MGKKNKKGFNRFYEGKKQEEMQEAISKKFGKDKVNEYNRNFNTLTKEEQQRVLDECNEIFTELSKHISEEVIYNDEIKDLLIRWHEWIRYFYEPSMEVLRGLGTMYAKAPDFRKNFERIDPKLPDFLPKAIGCYVDELEDKWLEEQYNVLEH